MASSFQSGCVFDNYSDLLRALTELESEMGQMFCVRNSERNPYPDLQAQFPRAKIKFECRHSGTKRQAHKTTGARPNQTTVKIGCPVFIYVTLDKDLRQLVVRNNHLEHNHPCGASNPEELTKTIRRKRRKTRNGIGEMEYKNENIEITEIADNFNEAGFPNGAEMEEFSENVDFAELIGNRTSSLLETGLRRTSSLLETGCVFDDYAHLLRAIADLESKTSQIFCIRYSERNNYPELQELFPRAKIKFECRCSGSKRQVYKLTGARPNQTTVKIGCPVFIYVTLDKDSRKLVVRSLNLEHNHPRCLTNRKRNSRSKRRKIETEGMDDDKRIKVEEEEDVIDNSDLTYNDER